MDIKKGKSAVYAQLVTPKGELNGFSSIFVPSTKFNKEGTFSANILISEEEGKKLYEAIKAVRTEQFKNFKKGKGDKVAEITAIKPFSVVDEETGEEVFDKEGRWILKTKLAAKIKDGKATNKVVVFDAKGKPVKACKIGSGSIVRLKIDLIGYSVGGKCGVSIKLLAVQIINLVEYQGGAGSSTSFDGFDVEDGYEFDEASAEEEEETEAEEVEAADDDNWDDEQGY